MALVDVSKGNFTSGELSPLMLARQEVDRYKNGAILLEDFIVLPQGGLTRRPGLRYVASCKFADRLALVKAFEPSTTAAYILEMGHEYLRFYRNSARIESAGTPVEVATPYQESDLRAIRTAQSNDVMILVHPSYAPRRLSRVSDTNWDIRPIVFDPPPLFEAGMAPAVELTLSAVTGSAITVTAGSAFFLAGDVQRVITAGIGRAVITSFTSATVVTATVIDTFSSVNIASGAWELGGSPVATLVPSRSGPVGALTTLSLSGVDTDSLLVDPSFDDPGAWADISSGTGTVLIQGGKAILSGGTGPGVGAIEQAVPGLAVGQEYALDVDIPVLPAVGDINVQIGSTSGGTEMAPKRYIGSGPPIRRVTFTATATTAYVQFRVDTDTTSHLEEATLRATKIDGWRAGDVGKYVIASDALVQVTAVANAQQATGRIIKEFDGTDGHLPGAWTLESPAWSDALGWPSEVLLYEGRLYFFTSPRFPKTAWGSFVDDFFNFATGEEPDDAMDFTLTQSGGNITLDYIVWVMPAENLLYGTTHGIYRLIGPGDDPLTPASLPRNRNQDAPGAASIKPVKVGGALLYVQRQGSSVLEVLLSENTSNTFNARDITITSDHLLKEHRVLELAYQAEPQSIVWAPRADGQALAMTYNLREDIRAWWRMRTQGSIASIATIPHPTTNGHQVWMAVQRMINGSPQRFIEVLMPEARMTLPVPVTMFNELTQEPEEVDGWDGLTLDCATVYTGAPMATFSVPHLRGATVTAVGDGAVFRNLVVPASGLVTLPQAVSSAYVGLEYVPRGRAMPVDVAVRGTTGQGLKKRWAQLFARVQQTACLTLQGERIPFRLPKMPHGQGEAPFSGDRVPGPILGWDRYGCVSFSVPDPLPATIIGIFGTLDTEVKA